MQNQNYQSPDHSNLLEADAQLNYSPSDKPIDISIGVSQRSGSGVRSNLFNNDAQDQEDWDEEEYEQQLKVFQQTQGVTIDDLENLQKTALLKKSLDNVKMRALEMEQTRKSPQVYNSVKSKVARNIRVKDKVVKKEKKAKQMGEFQQQIDLNEIEKINIAQIKENETLSVKQLGMTWNQKGSPWQKRHEEFVAEKERLIQEQEDQIESLQREIEQKRELRQSTSPHKFTSSKINQASPSFQQNTQSPPVRTEKVVEEQSINIQVEAQVQVNDTIPQATTQKAPVSMQIKSKKNNAVSSGLPTQIQGNGNVQQQVQVQQQQPPIQTKVEVKAEVKVVAPQQQVVQQQQKEVSRNKPEVVDKQDTFEEMAKVQKKQPVVRDEIKFTNRDLENKTQAIQQEFDQLLQEMMNNRQHRDTEGFYKVMDEYYHNNIEEKHASPTMRLISHKNSTQEHKQHMQSSIQRGDYSLTYCTAPGKSYVIEPQGGQINYDLAQKNPDKFYDQVYNQSITQHKVKGASSPTRKAKVQIQSKVTTRPFMKIIEKVKLKLVELLGEKMGIQFEDDILHAMDVVEVYKKIKTMMATGNVQILNQHNQPMFSKAITTVANLDSDEEFDQDELNKINEEIDEDVDGRSPDFKKGGNARLAVNDLALQDLEEEVRNHIRKNSQQRQ